MEDIELEAVLLAEAAILRGIFVWQLDRRFFDWYMTLDDDEKSVAVAAYEKVLSAV